MGKKPFYRKLLPVLKVFLVVFIMITYGCSREPAWKSVNEKIIQEHSIKVRARNDMQPTGIISNLAAGKVINRSKLPEVELAPGVLCKMYWGQGNLVNWMTMEPDSEIPEEILPCERLMVVWKGGVEQLINGEFVTMRQYNTVTNWTSTPHRDFVYLQKGTKNAMRAGSDGAEILEVYCPVRLDYVKKEEKRSLQRL